MNNKVILQGAVERWPSDRLRPDTLAFHSEEVVALISPDHVEYVVLATPTNPTEVQRACLKMREAGVLVNIFGELNV